MPLRKISLLSFFILVTFSTYAQFFIGVNKKTGALKMISNPTDQYKMNWVLSSSDSIPSWQEPSQDWALVFYKEVMEQ